MGVTRRIEHLRPINVQDEINDVIDRFNYADFDFSDSDNEAVGAEKNDDSSDLGRLSRSRKNKERRAERKMRRFLDVENHGVVTKSRMGARKQRQYENARIVMSFADQDDICTDFTDLVPHTVTAFDRLFLDQESMQVRLFSLGKSSYRRPSTRLIKQIDVPLCNHLFNCLWAGCR
ncbi:unnamed protein product [Nippostrongylus brasiliensis]|uniref:R3H-assoc domain-containing protein n=1 Tax=Nippostrongylus brasiliensis TaxID=27835 RepID=A0A0N4Y7W8_NIPBR|nr:unnamed protein product [Nippostrongylus brasiliensis]